MAEMHGKPDRHPAAALAERRLRVHQARFLSSARLRLFGSRGRGDAAIQRFEFTSEICWKALQQELKLSYAEEVRYPKGCHEAAFRVGLIDEDPCLALNRTVRDRYLTSHTYHEGLAAEIFGRLPVHAKAFKALLDALDRGPEN